jgi:ribosomal subunit interface protein
MQTPLQITFHEVPHSDAVEEYVRKRAGKIDTLGARISHCRVALEAPHRSASHGRHYRVRIALTVPGTEVVASRSPDEARGYEDLYAAIDAAFDDAGRQIQDAARRRRGEVKAHAPRE